MTERQRSSARSGSDHPAPVITDIWFRSPLSLAEIAERLGLEEPAEDVENYWEWIIGRLGDVEVDLTRTHTEPNDGSDARLFLLDDRKFTEQLVELLVDRLRHFVRGPIRCGRWEYLSGNEFERVVVREFSAAD